MSTLLQVRAEARPLTPLPVSGVAPGLAAIANGSYPYAKTLYLVMRAPSAGAVQQYLAFLASPAGRELLTGLGLQVSPGLIAALRGATMKRPGPLVARFTTTLAAIVAALLAVVPPVGYFALAHQYAAGATHAAGRGRRRPDFRVPRGTAGHVAVPGPPARGDLAAGLERGPGR